MNTNDKTVFEEATAKEATEKQSLFERLGGDAAVDLVVDNFYKKVLTDDSVNYMFAKTDMKRQANHQKKFITAALGGPNNYSGKNMRKAHQHVNRGCFPTEAHFNSIAGHLVNTLKEVGVGQDDINEVVKIVGGTKNDVIGHTPPAPKEENSKILFYFLGMLIVFVIFACMSLYFVIML